MESEPWFKNAVVYALDVEAFEDSTGNGVGDFEGLIEELDYLNRLGVSALWLLPFYPTPNRDNGYDVVDYYGVDPRLGSLGDFVEFVEAAEDRGIRVLIDLVVNHTSDQHPWFQRSRADPDSKYRDYYVWVEDPPPIDPERGSVFPGEVEDERVWTFDSEAEAYYYHRFYPFQPDLNLANPDVREEIYKIMAYWLKLGVAGFRVDAATLMIQPKHPDAEPVDDPHQLLRSLKRHVRNHRSDGVLLAEADDDPAELREYFGADEMDLLKNFVLNAHLIAGLATESAEPIVQGLERLPSTDGGQWSNFLRNYDELNIGRLPPELKEQVFETFAPARGCGSTAAAFAVAWRPCSTATRTDIASRSVCCSRCRAHRWCCTATRSGWGMTSRDRAGRRSGRRCSGPASPTPGSRPRRARTWSPR